MRPIHTITFLLFISFLGCKKSTTLKVENKSEKQITITKPTVSFTFDDGNTSDIVGFKFEEWNRMILQHLKKEKLEAVFFVTGKNKLSDKGQFLLNSWNDEGHKIANHTYSHPNFNSRKNSSSLFESELKKTDSIISNLSNKIKLFRFSLRK